MQQHQPMLVVPGGGGVVLESRLVSFVKGPLWGNRPDTRFMIITVVVMMLHAVGIGYLMTRKLAPKKNVELEQMSERFVKLIVEKPIPKEAVKKKAAETAVTKPADVIEEEVKTEKTPQPITQEQRAVAQKAVAQRAAKVEEKMRTVGVLGMLTGVGTTAKGPAVVDVLGAVKGKERFQDLDAALENVTGLTKATDASLADAKLVKSKDLSISRGESIDNLIASVGTAQTSDLSKKGDFVISRPEAIEGAASSSAKRDQKAINDLVLTHKASIRMSYEKFLKRDPSLQGKITVRFTITAAGSVSNVEILDNTTGNTELENEIVRKVSMWRFEAIPEGEATVTYPFVFRPSS